MKKLTSQTTILIKKTFLGFLNKNFSASKKVIFLILAGLTTVVILASFVLLLASQNDPKPVITPLSKQQAQVFDQSSIQDATYYINISQRFLTRAEELSKNPNQSAQDKEEILIAVQNSLETINEGINHYPKDDRLYAQRAKIHQGIATFSPSAIDAAIADLDQARRLSPRNPIYPKTQSLILTQKSRYQEASFYAKIAYELEPQNLQNLADLGKIQVKAGQIRLAVSSYQTLASLLPQGGQELEKIKQEIITLKTLLSQVDASQNTELFLVGEPTPSLKNIPADINLLPKEQATLPGNLIIASFQEQTSDQKRQDFYLNALAGEATIAAGITEITIYNNNLTENKKINLAPQGETNNQILYIKSKVARPDSGSPYFVVALSRPLNHNLAFKWWIIE